MMSLSSRPITTGALTRSAMVKISPAEETKPSNSRVANFSPAKRKNVVTRPERLHEQVVAVHGEEKQAGDQFEERAEKTALAAFVGVNELDQTEARFKFDFLAGEAHAGEHQLGQPTEHQSQESFPGEGEKKRKYRDAAGERGGAHHRVSRDR